MNFKEAYICFDPIEADVIKNMLQQEGIACLIRDMKIRPYPLTIGKFGEIRLAVDERCLKQALKILRQARADGYLSSQGRFKEDLPRPVE